MPPLRDQQGHGIDDSAMRHLSGPEYVAELGALILELESAKNGSHKLDVRIHYGFRILGGLGEDMASLLIKEGVSWPTVQETLNETVPPYSTSLDAALQGEEIVFSIRSAKGPRWGAMQRTSSGGEHLAWAATEPLARRLAALKSWRAELEKSLTDSESDPVATPEIPLSALRSDESGVDESAAGSEKEKTPEAESNKEIPDYNETRSYDDPERARNDVSEHTQHQDQHPDQSRREEKDWEILF